MSSKASTSKQNGSATSGTLNELRVARDNFHFKWKLDGFAEVPYITGYPVYSPTFCLGKGTESVWQLLMVKEFQSKKATRSKQDDDKSDDSPVGEAEVTEIHGGSPMDTSDYETADAEIENGNSANGEKTFENKKRALGFKVVKTEETLVWEVIKYHVEVKTGSVRVRVKEMTEAGFPNAISYGFQYLYEDDFEGIDLDEVDTISIEAYIEHKFLELFPLEQACSIEGNRIADDLFEFYKRPRYCDIVLKAGELEFPANRSILCARSYGFDCYLQELKKTPKTRLRISLSEVVLKAMLAYIYCGGIPVEFPIHQCLELYKAAKTFRVSGLRTAVFHFLMKKKLKDHALQPDESYLDVISQFELIKYSQHGDLEELQIILESENKSCK